MRLYEEFEAQWGLGVAEGSLSARDVAALRERLPEDVVDDLTENGLRSYGHGLIRHVDPRTFDDVLNDWFGPGHPYAAVLCFAFGDLLLVGPGGVYFLAVHHGELAKMGGWVDLFMGSALTDEAYVAGGIWGSLFDEVHPKLGDVGPQDCYAFVPALSLGGAADAEHVQKVALMPQLSILAQINGPVAVQG